MKTKSNYFYKTTNLINGRYYYGSGSKKNYLGSGKILIEAISKYGKNNFKIEILKYFNSRKDAFLFEDRFLKLFKISEDPLSYNIKDCAVGGATIKGDNHPRPWLGKTHSNEYINKLKETMTGEGNPMYGKTHSNLTIERMKAAWNKRKLEGRTNKSGHIMSDETKLKIGNSIRKKHQEKHSK
jgi:group I intron endonuclease